VVRVTPRISLASDIIFVALSNRINKYVKLKKSLAMLCKPNCSSRLTAHPVQIHSRVAALVWPCAMYFLLVNGLFSFGAQFVTAGFVCFTGLYFLF
jgi:hypothetical protein